MFQAQTPRLSVASVQTSRHIQVDLRLDNDESNLATIQSYDFELWLPVDESTGEAHFLERLRPDLTVDLPGRIEPRSTPPIRLLWRYTPVQLQLVEDLRKGRDIAFQIRGRLLVTRKYLGSSGFPDDTSQQWEPVLYQSAHHVRFEVPESEWVALLGKIGFRHLILYELPALPFPPGFAKSQSHLEIAWQRHREGLDDDALSACQKAFECLGFHLYGTKVSREQLLENLMASTSTNKRKIIEELWAHLGTLLHSGRHDGGAAVPATHADGELAVVCTTALIGYLAKQQ